MEPQRKHQVSQALGEARAARRRTLPEGLERRALRAFLDLPLPERPKASEGASPTINVPHDDAGREQDYEPETGSPGAKMGAFARLLLGQAKMNGWRLVGAKDDWKRIFGFGQPMTAPGRGPTFKAAIKGQFQTRARGMIDV